MLLSGFFCKVIISSIFLQWWNWSPVLWTAISSTFPCWYWNWSEIIWWKLCTYLSCGTNDGILFWDFLFTNIIRTIIVNKAQDFKAGWPSKEPIGGISIAPAGNGCCNLCPDTLCGQLLRDHNTAEYCCGHNHNGTRSGDQRDSDIVDSKEPSTTLRQSCNVDLLVVTHERKKLFTCKFCS